VLAGDRIFAADEEGITHIFKAGPQFEALARNDLGEPVLASPAISGDRLFLRSAKTLWCLDGKTVGSQTRTTVPPAGKVVTQQAPVSKQKPVAPDESGWDVTDWLVGGLSVLAVLLVGLNGWLFLAQRGRAPKEVAPAPARTTPARVEAAVVFVSFACPDCGKRLKVKEELAGKKVKCPQCARVLPVPERVPARPDGSRARPDAIREP
jgi:hypothetical protein